MKTKLIRLFLLGALVAAVSGFGQAKPSTSSGQGKPNILVISGDDIGQRPALFSIDQVIEKLESSTKGK